MDITQLCLDDILKAMRHNKIRSVEIDTSKTGINCSDSYEATVTEWYGAQTKISNLDTDP